MQRTTKEDGAAHSANALREVAAKIDELVAEQRHLTREVAESHNNKARRMCKLDDPRGLKNPPGFQSLIFVIKDNSALIQCFNTPSC